MRKGGLEPPRYCYRQPLKLVETLCRRELTRVLRTNVEHERARANACDDFIRTNSHTPNVLDLTRAFGVVRHSKPGSAIRLGYDLLLSPWLLMP